MKLRDFLNAYNPRRCTAERAEEAGLWRSNNVLPIRIYTKDSFGSMHYFEFANSTWDTKKDLDSILNPEILDREIELFDIAQCPGLEDFIEVYLKSLEIDEDEDGEDDGSEQD